MKPGHASLGPTDAGARLDHAVRSLLERHGVQISVREVRAALARGWIRVDGRQQAPGRPAKGTEDLDLSEFEPRASFRITGRPDLLERCPLIEAGPDWFALSKPSGLPSLPRHVRSPDSALHAAVAHDPRVANAGPALEGGAVHRLDNDASGVLVFATSESARRRLRRRFSQGEVDKRYTALVHWGRPPGAFSVRAEIESRGRGRVRVHPADDPSAPESRVSIVDSLEGWARVEVATRQGRHHQVRAHLAYAETPIAGDRTYAPPDVASALERLGLHASTITIEGQRVIAPLPEGWEDLSACFA